jgi:hypothetical protein
MKPDSVAQEIMLFCALDFPAENAVLNDNSVG